MSRDPDGSDYFTPEELGKELGVAPKTIRAWLRKVEMRAESEKHRPWRLSRDEADFVRREFG